MHYFHLGLLYDLLRVIKGLSFSGKMIAKIKFCAIERLKEETTNCN